LALTNSFFQHNEDPAAFGTDDDYDEAEEEIHKNEEGKSDNEPLDPVSEQDVRLLFCNLFSVSIYLISKTLNLSKS
jgi:hypothetical protein